MTFKPFLAYSASAGSGKTFALSVRYVSLLFMGESSSSILAATFTNKAASEMRQRVLNSLRLLGTKKDDPFMEEVSAQTGLSKEALIAKQPEVLERFLSSSSYIVTLDSFFASVLRSASLELGLDPGFKTKEKQNDKRENYFLEELRTEGLLSSLVRLSIDIEDKRFEKIFDLMDHFYRVDPLLKDTVYKNDPLWKIEEEIDSCRARLYTLVSESGASATAINNFLPQSAKVLVTKTVFEKESLLDHRNYKKYVEKNPVIEEVYLELKYMLKKWIRAKEAGILEALFQVYDYYKNATIMDAKRSNILSFDDLGYFTYRLLHESISKEFFYFKIDSKFNHMLLDEFQDTSTLQFLLLKPLIDEIFAGKGQNERRSFFYVGDTKQSLYRFRGGVEELFDKVATYYGMTIEPMDTNYRSSALIVEQVNQWFTGQMEGYTPQKSRPGASKGYVEVIESETLVDEAVAQAKRLISLGIDVDDIAFLVSTNKDGVALQEACMDEGIHTLLQTSSSLKNLPKIAALSAMLGYLFYGEAIDAQPLLLRVGKSLDQIETLWFEPTMEPIVVLDRLIREFGYFDEDKNILKLLEFASHFSSIPEFLEEFTASSIPVASHSIHGAKIMTVHGSKGLEFEYVIVMDKVTQPNNDKSVLMYEYNDDLYIDRILYRMQGRENFDADYAAMVEKRRFSQSKDRKNVLYVALTRAAEGMIVVKKPKGSNFDEIGLVPMQIGSLGSKPRENHSIKSSVKEQLAACITISNYGIQEMIKREDEEEKDYEALLFGKALHYGLEMLESFEKESIPASMTAVRNRFGRHLSLENMEQIQGRIERLIKHHPFKDLLANAKVMKELSLGFDGELKQVDLLLEYENEYLVIDYKSSKKQSQKHQNQVAYYQKSIQGITHKPTKGMIIYLLENEIETLSLNKF
ncbi:MAG: RecB-like helicase [Campylobacterales bacterium]|nr:RecB-like helicase [Campylobacterales bacterium]